MFNRAWLFLAGLALVAGLAAGRSGLSILGTLLLAVAGLAWGWNRWALHGVEYRRRLSERRAFLGETLTLELSAANRKLLPLACLQVEDQYPLQLTFLDAELLPSSQPTAGYLTSALSLRWFERVRWRLHIRCDYRGLYYLGPIRLTTGDIFGLFRQQQTLEEQELLVVYPRLYSLAELGLPAKEPFGDIHAHLRILEDPSRTVGIRDYESADPLKRVHWKATARRQQLQVRVYEPTQRPQLLICLNVDTLPYNWQGVIPELLEQAVSVAASLASYGADAKYQVGLLANGCWPLSDQPLKVLPGRSPDQLTHILEALAAINTMPIAHLHDLILKASASLPWSATLVVVTAIVSDELLEALLRLSTAGRPVVLLSLDPQAPAWELPGIVCYRLASGPGEEPIRFAPLEVAV